MFCGNRDLMFDQITQQISLPLRKRSFIDVMRSVERIDNTVAFLIEEFGLMGIGIPQRKRQSFPPRSAYPSFSM